VLEMGRNGRERECKGGQAINARRRRNWIGLEFIQLVGGIPSLSSKLNKTNSFLFVKFSKTYII
jgi:hypothetical protein